MKKLLLTSALTALSFTNFAQKITVTESSQNIGGGSNNSLMVTIYQTTPEIVAKEVKSLLKDYNAKVSSKDDGWFGDNAVIKKMGNNTVDIYAKWDKTDEDRVTLVMAFDLGGDFISSSKHPNEFNVAKDIVQNFATKTTSAGITLLVKGEQKTFDKLGDDQKRLEKENANLNNDVENYKQKIEDYKQKIKKAQDDIEANKTNQEKKKDEISAQQRVLNSAKDKQKMVE